MAITETTLGQAATAGFGATTITLTGSLLGIGYDVLAVALFGGLLALLHLPPMPGVVRKFASVLTSALAGGVLSPVALAASTHYAPWVVNASSPLAVKLACAFVLGLGAQVVIPVAFEWLRSKRRDLGKGS